MAKEIAINERLPCISEGPFSKVFRGTYDGIQVAVKRICVETILGQDEFQRLYYLNLPEQFQRPHRQVSFVREESALRDLCHPNIVKLFGVKEEYPFRYFAIELCTSSLYQYCHQFNHGLQECLPPMPSDATVLLDIIRGLRYVHFKGIAHRNIHPKNILISSSSPVIIKLADFGLSKPVNDGGSHSISRDNRSVCYKAPEMLNNNPDKRGSIASDTFSAGLVFFYFLSKGFHLFGSNPIRIRTSILRLLEQPNEDRDNEGRQSEANGVNWNKLYGDQMHFKALIESMIKPLPGDRAHLCEIESILSEIVGVPMDEPNPQHIQHEEESNLFDFDYLM